MASVIDQILPFLSTYTARGGNTKAQRVDYSLLQTSTGLMGLSLMGERDESVKITDKTLFTCQNMGGENHCPPPHPLSFSVMYLFHANSQNI